MTIFYYAGQASHGIIVDPKNPDCLMFRLKAFVRPRKEIKHGK